MRYSDRTSALSKVLVDRIKKANKEVLKVNVYVVVMEPRPSFIIASISKVGEEAAYPRDYTYSFGLDELVDLLIEVSYLHDAK